MRQKLIFGVLAAAILTGCSSASSEFQEQLLSDGEISREEYQLAMAGMVECLRDAGFEVEGPTPENASFLSYTVVLDDPELRDRFDQVSDQCHQQFLSEVELGWADANAPSPTEEAALYGRVADCLRDKGLDVPSTSPTELDKAIREDPVVYRECFNAAVANSESS